MGNDATGWKRGQKGYANEESAFRKPDFDRAKQQGPLSGDGDDGGFAPTDKGKGFKGIRT
jgi:hypothetical protein